MAEYDLYYCRVNHIQFSQRLRGAHTVSPPSPVIANTGHLAIIG